MMLYQKKTQALIVRSTVPQVIKIILYILVVPIYKIEGLVVIALIDRFTEPLIPLLSIIKPGIKLKRS